MDLYKKKSLKFSGMGRGVRFTELDAARRSSRLQRFSLQRSIGDDTDVPKENVPSSSRIPTFGKQNPQILAREERLKKWKEEKMLKKKLEQSKRPAFKPGGFALKLQPSLVSSNRFGELSRIQGFQSSNNNSSIKPSSSIKSKDIGCKSIPIKSQANGIKFQASKSKDDVTKPPIARPQAISKIPPARSLKTDNITIRNPKPLSTTKPILKQTKSKDLCVPSYTKPKVAPSNLKPSVTTASDPKASKKIPYSGITKPTSLLPQQKLLNVPSKVVKPTMLSSNSAPVKQIAMGKIPIEAKVSRKPAEKPKSEERSLKNETVKSGIGKVQPKKEAKRDLASVNTNSKPQSQPSLNEAEKSFAPIDFVFRPPVELQVSFLSEISPFEIFESLKNENGRTSTPKQSEWKEYEDLDGTFSCENSNTKKSTFVKDSSSIPSSETKFIKGLLDNSPSEIELSVPNFPLDKLPEEQDLEVVLQEENHDKILPEVNLVGAALSKPSAKTALLDEFHLKLDVTNADTLGTEQSHTASSNTTDSQVIVTETDLNKIEFCLPAQNETKQDISAHVPKNSPLETLGSLESEKKTAFEFRLPLKDLPSNANPELDTFLVMNPIDSSQVNQTKNASSATSFALSTLEEDEVGSLSDSMLQGQTFSKETRSKRFTRSYRQSEKPTLVKISESPEIRETPKSVRRVKAQETTTAGEFTPRRSRRLARLSVFNSEENLFDVRESLYSSPAAESSQLTYDFDRLHLESKDTSEVSVFHRYSTRSNALCDGKVSLLYTPPRTRKSTRKTVKGDLMSFSPSV